MKKEKRADQRLSQNLIQELEKTPFISSY